MAKITCIIIDDEIRIANRLEKLLLKFNNIKVLAKEVDSEYAIKKVLELKPSIVFIEIEMSRLNGFDVIKAIRKKHYYPTFIFVTTFDQYVIEAIRHSVFDYLLKPIRIDELKKTLERYEKSKAIRKNIMDSPLLLSLTNREKEVLKFAINGITSKKTAEKLFISKSTVDTHHKKILEKTNEKKISDLIIKALSVL